MNTLAAFITFLLMSVPGGRINEEGITTKSFTVSKGGTIDVQVDGGDIRVIPWDKNEVFVKVRGLEDEDTEDLTMSAGENIVRIKYRSQGWSDNVRFDINVPQQFNIKIRTSNGTVIVEGPLTGDVTGSTSAGNIRLGNITGEVDMNTSGGDIQAGNVSGTLNLKTSGGDIVVGAAGGETDLSTSGGNISVDNVKKSLRARTSGGDILVGDIGGEVNVSTSGGNVSIGKVNGSAVASTAGGDIELLGASGRVSAKTAGGNVRLLNITGTIEAKTAGGEMYAELAPSGKGGSRFATAAGDIRIHGRWKSMKDEYRIRTDFKAESYETSDEEREIHASYKINGGGDVITLETVNADIVIGKMSDRKRSSHD